MDRSPFKCEDNITKNEHSALFFLINVEAVFKKGHLETPKGHTEMNDILMKCKIQHFAY